MLEGLERVSYKYKTWNYILTSIWVADAPPQALFKSVARLQRAKEAQKREREQEDAQEPRGGRGEAKEATRPVFWQC